jgi:hypothetical protein
MSTTLAIIIAAIVIVAILVAVGIFLFMRDRQSRRLQNRFGPEYQRAVEETGSRRQAETKLHTLEKRVSSFTIRALAPEERARYVNTWQRVQAEFVDTPGAAVDHADELLGAVMSARGYPVGDFEQRAADLSADHPTVVQNYRAGHDIALRQRRGEADTEALRQAMIHYRALFAELVEDPEIARTKAS